jgi:hypothetical protein
MNIRSTVREVGYQNREFLGGHLDSLAVRLFTKLDETNLITPVTIEETQF